MPDELHKMSCPFLLLAGPGTGKTYCLAKRLNYLVGQRKISPENITMITFTTSATRNMHARISDPSNPELYIPHENQPKRICTMHSLGYRILREKSSVLALDESLRVIKPNGVVTIIEGNEKVQNRLDHPTVYTPDDPRDYLQRNDVSVEIIPANELLHISSGKNP